MEETRESLGFIGYRYHPSKHLVRPIIPDGGPSKLIDGKNMYHHLLTMRTFPGFEKLFADQLGSAGKRTCVGAFPYIKDDGSVYLILCYPDKIYQYSPGAASPTDITGGATLTGGNTNYFSAVYWADTSSGYVPWIVLSNGVNPMLKWNGSGNVATLGGSPPIAKYLSSFAGHLFASYVIAGGYDYSQRDQRSDIDEAEDWAGGLAGSNDLRQTPGAITGSLTFGEVRIIFREFDATVCRSTGYDPPLIYDEEELPVGAIAPKSIIKVWRYDLGFFLSNDLNVYLVRKDGGFMPIGDDITHRIRDWANDETVKFSFAVYYPEIDHILLAVPSTNASGDVCNRILAFDLGYYLKTGETAWSTPIELGPSFTAGAVLRFRQSYKIGDLGEVSTDGLISGLDPKKIGELYQEAAFSEVALADNNGYVYRFDPNIDTYNGATINWEAHTKDHRLSGNRNDQFRLYEYELEYEDPPNANATCTVYVSTSGGNVWDKNYQLQNLPGAYVDQEELQASAWFDVVGQKHRMKLVGTYHFTLHGQRWIGTNEGRR